MTRALAALAFAFALVLAAACSGDSATSANPVAPSLESTALTAAGGQDKTLICHENPDGDDDDPFWVVISVANGDQYLEKHPSDCAVEGYEIGADCTGECVVEVLDDAGDVGEGEVGEGTVVESPGHKNAVQLCHFEEEPEIDELVWTVINVSGNGNAPNAHAAHGDIFGECPEGLPVGSDCSSCVPI